jgi:peroxiredoxin
MKKIFFALAMLIWLTACSSDSYKIKGTLEDVTTGTVYLKKIDPYGLSIIDSSAVVKGSFSFEGSQEHAELHLLFFEENKVPVAFFLENGKITVTGSSDKLDDAIVKGSKNSELFSKFNKEVPHLEKVEKMREEFFKAQSTGDQATMESIMADMEIIIEEQQEYYRNFVKTNNNNAVGAFLAINMAEALTYEELEELTTSLEAALKEHPYVGQLKNVLEPMKAQMEAEAAVAIGNEAPLFTLVDINGNQINLESFRGKYVFLDFWAAWCRPCRMENPILKQAYDRFGGENFEIVSVSLDQTADAWKKAVEEDGLNWTLLHDPIGETANVYAVQTIPYTLLLDKNGVIMQKQLRGEELLTVLEDLLK